MLMDCIGQKLYGFLRSVDMSSPHRRRAAVYLRHPEICLIVTFCCTESVRPGSCGQAAGRRNSDILDQYMKCQQTLGLRYRIPKL